MVEQSGETPPALRSGETVETKLLRIAEKARKEPKFQFTSLYHLMNEELLGASFERLSKSKAAGIDEVTKEMYAADLEGNVKRLAERLQKMAYIPQPVRRIYIPKPGSDKQRPIGIPCLEDKIVQAGLVRVLDAIYEQDFIEDSYGFRPKRSCHDALRALNQEVHGQPINFIAEADIKGFFDNVKQDWLMKFLSFRIGDTRILRMVKRFLKAGIAEDGEIRASDEGTPQGGVISPLLANIYLHYALDLWFEKVFRKSSIGRARMIRYADDFVACFEIKEEAHRFQAELMARLGRFGLEVEPTKTKVLEFGRYAENNARARGERPGTFDFLGFTHYLSRALDGQRFRMKRKTAKKKFRAKVADFKAWIKRSRTKQISEIWATVAQKLRGHYSYYGVTDNYAALDQYTRVVHVLLVKWLRRRSQRRKLNWEKFDLMLTACPLPKPRITGSLFQT